ncbi:MAG: type I restriction-modification enzyme R subunit C-terminal domain-containing protein, partial [Bacteroidota bacterium]
SKTKFNQMIGRGTRLRPELFGPGRNKQHFLIFDYCGNFEFFEQNPDGYDTTASASVTAKVFEKRLVLAAKLTNEPYNRDEELQAYRTDLLDLLHQQVSNLERQSVQVRPKLRLVDRLSERSVWDHLQAQERTEIVRELAELIPADIDEDEMTRRFDLLMLTLQHEVIDGVLQEKKTKEIAMELGEHLYSKRHIPAIKKVLPAVEKVISDTFWESPKATGIDDIRKQLRDLMHLIERNRRAPVYTDFEDEFSEVKIDEPRAAEPTINKDRYLRKIRKFIEQHGNHLVIEKIRKAKPLTDRDIEALEEFLLESDPGISREEFHELIGEEMELIKFVRSISGLERKAVIQQFEEFLRDKRLSSTQIQFIEQMIEFYTEKGHLEVANLYEPPFDFIDQDGIDGVFRDRDNVIDLLIEKVEELNELRVG